MIWTQPSQNYRHTITRSQLNTSNMGRSLHTHSVHVSLAWIWQIYLVQRFGLWVERDHTSGTLDVWRQLCLLASILLKASFSETLNHLLLQPCRVFWCLTSERWKGRKATFWGEQGVFYFLFFYNCFACLCYIFARQSQSNPIKSVSPFQCSDPWKQLYPNTFQSSLTINGLLMCYRSLSRWGQRGRSEVLLDRTKMDVLFRSSIPLRENH